jgi:hypothetical protein
VVEDLVDRREFAYSSFLVASADAFLPSASPHDGVDQSEGGQSRHHPSAGSHRSSVLDSSSIKGIIPSGETIANITSSATSTATAAGGWMSSRLTCERASLHPPPYCAVLYCFYLP